MHGAPAPADGPLRRARRLAPARMSVVTVGGAAGGDPEAAVRAG